MIRFWRRGTLWNVAYALPAHLDIAVPPAPAPLSAIAQGYPNGWRRIFNLPYFDRDKDGSLTGTPGRVIAVGRVRGWGPNPLPASTPPGPWPVVYMDGSGVHLDPEGRPHPAPAAWWEVAAGPLLIWQGQARDLAAEIARGGYTGLREDERTWRCGLGRHRNGLLCHVVAAYDPPNNAMGATLVDLQAIGLQLGLDWFIAGDGGGSVGLIDAKEGNRANSDRKLPAALVFREEAEPPDAAPAPDVPVPDKPPAPPSSPRRIWTPHDNLRAFDPTVTVAQLERYLRRTPLAGLGAAFHRVARRYWLNPAYPVAHARWEAVNPDGTLSRIALLKNNLYGWMAYDHDPEGSAMAFASFEDCIEHVMGWIAEEYLSPGGEHWAPDLGPSLAGMAKLGWPEERARGHRYATDPGWAAGISGVMTEILNA